MLASSVRDLPAGSLIFDLGTGNGDAVLAASSTCPGCTWVGVDCRREALREFCSHWGDEKRDGVLLTVCTMVEDVTAAFPRGCADAVLANPPYGVTGRKRVSPSAGRERSRSGADTLLFVFLRAASHLLRPGGRLYTVNRPGNLDRLLTGCAAFDMGVDWIRPAGENGKEASLVIAGALRSVRREMRLLPRMSVAEITSQFQE